MWSVLDNNGAHFILQSIKLPTDLLLSLQTDEDLQKSVTTVSWVGM